MATEFIPAGVELAVLADAAQMASLADETPEGRSIVHWPREIQLRRPRGCSTARDFVPFTRRPHERMWMWMDVALQGAADSVKVGPLEAAHTTRLSRRGGTDFTIRGTPLFGREHRVLGVILLKDIVKGESRNGSPSSERWASEPVMITGGQSAHGQRNRLRSGRRRLIAQAKPEDKLARIRREQEGGKLIA